MSLFTKMSLVTNMRLLTEISLMSLFDKVDIFNEISVFTKVTSISLFIKLIAIIKNLSLNIFADVFNINDTRFTNMKVFKYKCYPLKLLSSNEVFPDVGSAVMKMPISIGIMKIL